MDFILEGVVICSALDQRLDGAVTIVIKKKNSEGNSPMVGATRPSNTIFLRQTVA